MIAATAGTTNAGMIDPLDACGAIARKYGAWYHVDAAWGGAAIASDKLRPALAGIELADSVTIDAHKWFATTMACGMFITRHPSISSSAFNVSTGFMPSNLPDRDPYVTTIQWSRRFLGLRLFLSLATAGWSGYGKHVERSVVLINRLGQRLLARGCPVVNASPLAVLCFTPPNESYTARSVVERVLSSGRAWLATALFEGREVIRACATHGEATVDDVDELADVLQAAMSSSKH
jgi:glutamate/tyrosine decarboxylase-like PLP-dependent enzyme